MNKTLFSFVESTDYRIKPMNPHEYNRLYNILMNDSLCKFKFDFKNL